MTKRNKMNKMDRCEMSNKLLTSPNSNVSLHVSIIRNEFIVWMSFIVLRYFLRLFSNSSRESSPRARDVYIARQELQLVKVFSQK